MTDEGFEKGLKLLLNNAYDRPEADEGFRTQLLERLRDKQTQARSARKRRIVTLYTSCASVTAAAAAVVISIVPLSSPSATGSSSFVVSATQPQAVFRAGDLNQKRFSTPVRTPNLSVLFEQNRQAQSGGAMQAVPVAASTGAVRSGMSGPKSRDSIPATSIPAAEMLALAGQTAHALNAIDLRDGNSGAWRALKPGSRFPLRTGLEIRTPVGAVDPVTIAISNGTMLMLDGMSRIMVDNKELRLCDGRAVISLTHSKLAVGLQLADQELSLQPGAMAFLRVEDGEDYASNGSPVPVLVLLKGQALPLAADGQVRDGAGVLTAQKVYELYNTGTGRYPSRVLGSYETQQRFQPMINAIASNNEYY